MNEQGSTEAWKKFCFEASVNSAPVMIEGVLLREPATDPPEVEEDEELQEALEEVEGHMYAMEDAWQNIDGTAVLHEIELAEASLKKVKALWKTREEQEEEAAREHSQDLILEQQEREDFAQDTELSNGGYDIE